MNDMCDCERMMELPGETITKLYSRGLWWTSFNEFIYKETGMCDDVSQW